MGIIHESRLIGFLKSAVSFISDMFSESRIIELICAVITVISESAVYKFIIGIMKGISFLFRDCCIYRGLYRKDKTGEYMSESVILGLADKIIRLVISACRVPYKLFGRLNDGSLNKQLYSGITREFHLSYENFLGLELIAIALIPGQYWNNAYGLLAAAAAVILYFAGVLSGKGYSVSLRKFSIAMIIFIITCFYSVAVSVERADSIRVLMFFITSFGFMLAIGGSMNSEEKLDKFIGFIYTGVIITSIYCIYQALTGVEIDARLVDETTSGSLQRAFSTFENPNNYAEYLVLFMPFMAAFALNRKTAGQRACFLLLLVLPLAALVTTYSRSCWVTFFISAVIFILFYNYKCFPYFIIVCLLAIPFLPHSVWNRILTIGSMDDSSNYYRIQIWQGALSMIKEWGFTGTGLGPVAFTKIYRDYAVAAAVTAPHAHMVYLEIFLEAGIISILSFLCWWIMTIKRFVTALIRDRLKGRKIRNIIIASIASFTAITFVSGVEYIWFYPRVLVMFFVAAGITFAAAGIIRRGE